MQGREHGQGEGGVQRQERAGGDERARAFQPTQPAVISVRASSSTSTSTRARAGRGARPECVERHHGPLAARQQRGLREDAPQHGVDQTYLTGGWGEGRGEG